MKSNSAHNQESPAARQDRICESFLNEYREHENEPDVWPAPRIEHFLTKSPEKEQADLLQDLVLEELKRRWTKGDLPTRDEYVIRFPAFQGTLEKAFEVGPAEGGLRYALHAKIDKGGFGVVYRGRDNEIQRPIAIKVLHGLLLDGSAKQVAFQQEVRLAGKLNHDNIVRIFDTGQFSNGRRFVVMDYIEGDTLEAHLCKTQFSPAEVVELLLPVIRAVQYAHESGLVAHRDLKPANILLDRNGKLHVADFGLAIATDQESTNQGGIAGTPSYMAPEQIRGTGPLEHCDVWALGVILYEMLTGRRPFQGASQEELFHEIQNADPAPPSQIRPTDGLDEICFRCLQKDPTKRFVTAADLADELVHWLEPRRKRHPVYLSKKFNGMLRQLGKLPGGQQALKRVQAAQKEAASKGEIRSLKQVSIAHASTDDLEIFEIGDGYHLLVQLIDTSSKARGFLSCGRTDETDAWLADHKEYRWVKNQQDGRLVFTQVSEDDPRQAPLLDQDLSSPEPFLALPLLRHLTAEEWKILSLPEPAQAYLQTLSGSAFEEDQAGVFGHIVRVCRTNDQSKLVRDIIVHAHKGELDALHQRILLNAGNASILSGAAVTDAMAALANSEQFVTWEDTQELPWDGEWEDWMLFLHPEQKAYATKDFNGPARLRGVSGSGKTCVMIHRARYLVKRYRARVLLVTLTGSMRNLLESLLRRLCGPESSFIDIRTMSGLGKDVFRQLSGGTQGITFVTDTRDGPVADAVWKALERVEADNRFSRCGLVPLTRYERKNFLQDEISYVRSRLSKPDYDSYLSAKAFPRSGRGRGITEESRSLFLDAIRFYDAELDRQSAMDPECVVQVSNALLLRRSRTSDACRWRCVLVDEVQDLSQLEVTLLANLVTPEGERIAEASDGLFLVGDGAQTVYKRGFRLSHSGVIVGNRSFAFRKNYRNTKEILRAAYSLIQAYEFADVDEDNIAKPLEPEFATRHGEKPQLVRCNSLINEMRYVAGQVKAIVEESSHEGASQICIIAATQQLRDEVGRALDERKVKWVALKEDSSPSSVPKISTIESAKGHEFSHVFVPGLNEGVLPRPQEEIRREAARLYAAMTRARDSLHLSFTSSSDLVPSQFLTAIQDDCEEWSWNGSFMQPIG